MATQSFVPKDVTYSRQETQCDYCGIELNRQNIKKHTKQAHPRQHSGERQIMQGPLDSVFAAAKRRRIEANLNEAIGVIETEKKERLLTHLKLPWSNIFRNSLGISQ